MIYRHFAFFSRLTGGWLGEIAGHVPHPDLPAYLRGDRRARLMEQWQVAAIRGLGTTTEAVGQLWSPSMSRVPFDQQVALDVTRFAWPIGDHIWHRWCDVDQMLDWPDVSGHRFIEVDDALRVVAQQHSHRPVRCGVPGQHVIDITGTALEPYWGWLWGQFVPKADGWGFEPRIIRRRGAIDELMTAPAPVRQELGEATIDPVIVMPARDAVLVGARG